MGAWSAVEWERASCSRSWRSSSRISSRARATAIRAPSSAARVRPRLDGVEPRREVGLKGGAEAVERGAGGVEPVEGPDEVTVGAGGFGVVAVRAPARTPAARGGRAGRRCRDPRSRWSPASLVPRPLPPAPARTLSWPRRVTAAGAGAFADARPAGGEGVAPREQEGTDGVGGGGRADDRPRRGQLDHDLVVGPGDRRPCRPVGVDGDELAGDERAVAGSDEPEHGGARVVVGGAGGWRDVAEAELGDPPHRRLSCAGAPAAAQRVPPCRRRAPPRRGGWRRRWRQRPVRRGWTRGRWRRGRRGARSPRGSRAGVGGRDRRGVDLVVAVRPRDRRPPRDLACRSGCPCRPRASWLSSSMTVRRRFLTARKLLTTWGGSAPFEHDGDREEGQRGERRPVGGGLLGGPFEGGGRSGDGLAPDHVGGGEGEGGGRRPPQQPGGAFGSVAGDGGGTGDEGDDGTGGHERAGGDGERDGPRRPAPAVSTEVGLDLGDSTSATGASAGRRRRPPITTSARQPRTATAEAARAMLTTRCGRHSSGELERLRRRGDEPAVGVAVDQLRRARRRAPSRRCATGRARARTARPASRPSTRTSIDARPSSSTVDVGSVGVGAARAGVGGRRTQHEPVDVDARSSRPAAATSVCSPAPRSTGTVARPSARGPPVDRRPGRDGDRSPSRVSEVVAAAGVDRARRHRRPASSGMPSSAIAGGTTTGASRVPLDRRARRRPPRRRTGTIVPVTGAGRSIVPAAVGRHASPRPRRRPRCGCGVGTERRPSSTTPRSSAVERDRRVGRRRAAPARVAEAPGSTTSTGSPSSAAEPRSATERRRAGSTTSTTRSGGAERARRARRRARRADSRGVAGERERRGRPAATTRRASAGSGSRAHDLGRVGPPAGQHEGDAACRRRWRRWRPAGSTSALGPADGCGAVASARPRRSRPGSGR